MSLADPSDSRVEQLLSPTARLLYRGMKRKQVTRLQQKDFTLLQWVLEHRKMLVPDRPFVPRPHLVPLYEDDCKELVMMKAAQLGSSEYLVSWLLYVADVKNATGLYVFPTDTHVSDFSAARFGPAIEPSVSPYLASIIVSGDAHGADRVGLKRVRNRFIYFRGARIGPEGRAPQLRSIDGDALVFDEFDEIDPRAIPIARERLEASKFAQIREASTPTFPETGIHQEYLESDQRGWHIRCTACGQFTLPDLSSLILEMDGLGRPVRWNGQTNEQPYLACRHCGGMLDRESGEGEWVAAYPNRRVHGYHMLRLSLPGKPLDEILRELNTVNETKRQQAYNQGLGLPYVPSSAQSISNSVLDAARREYAQGVVPKEKTYAGIDVGGVLHVIIRGTSESGERPLRFAGEVNTFEEATRLLKMYNVKVCVVDAMPETRASRGLQSSAERNVVWLSYYADSGEGTRKESIGTWKAAEGTVLVDRTRSLDATFALFHDASQGRGGNTLPANARELRDYYSQLRASKRVLVERDHKQTAVYIESSADHYAHAENYCYVASTCPHGAGWSRGAGG